MASLKLLLGLIPSASKIEQAEKALIAEFDKLNKFAASDTLAKYSRLDSLVNSSEFIQKCKDIKGLSYKYSEEFEREKEFKSLQKASDIVMYFKTISGTALKRFRDMEGSAKISDFEALEKFTGSVAFKEKQNMKPIRFKDTDEYRKFDEFKSLSKDPEVKAYLKAKGKKELTKSKSILRFEELEAYVKTPAFIAKKNMRPITFKDSEEYKKLQEYKRVKNSLEIKEFYKFRDSKEYANFLNTDGSKRLERYNELKEYVATAGFKQKKEYLLDKRRFEKTEMYKDEQEYKKLKKEPDIIWYFKTKDSDKFDLLRSRELSFSDEFDNDRLDTSKWITGYYWGEKLLKDRYTVESDLQAYTEKDNFEIRNSVLKIVTRPQKTTGKVWTAAGGFAMKEFSFTSGMINSGSSFRQKYGTFSAKVKLGDANVKNAFWMLSDKITPHIDICRTGAGKVWFDFFSAKSKSAVKSSLGSKYANDFFIYTLEWTSDRLTWKINNTEVFTQTGDVPQEPMYVLFSGGLEKPVNSSSAMEIDWIRVYKPAK